MRSGRLSAHCSYTSATEFVFLPERSGLLQWRRFGGSQRELRLIREVVQDRVDVGRPGTELIV